MTTLLQSVHLTETMTPKGPAAVTTGIAGQHLVRFHPIHQEDRSEQDDGWNRHLDIILRDWLPDLANLDDDEFTAPSLTVFGVAATLAEALRDNGWEPPDRVVMDGDGGIVFERRQGDEVALIEIYGEEDAKAELIGLQDGKVYFREVIDIPIL